MFAMRYVSKEDKIFWYTLDGHLPESGFVEKVRNRRGYIIADNSTPVGVMRYNLLFDTIPFLTLLHIREGFQRKGLGRQAMAAWEGEMKSLGHEMVMASTQVDEGAQHFYRKLGYVDRGSLFFDNTPFAQPQELFMVKVL